MSERTAREKALEAMMDRFATILATEGLADSVIILTTYRDKPQSEADYMYSMAGNQHATHGALVELVKEDLCLIPGSDDGGWFIVEEDDDSD